MLFASALKCFTVCLTDVIRVSCRKFRQKCPRCFVSVIVSHFGFEGATLNGEIKIRIMVYIVKTDVT